MSEKRPLSERERKVIEAARDKAFVLYEGREVPHRSCGIALAETFGLPTRPYQALRRGGITGCGTCGAVRGGEQILGEILGDPDPSGAVTAPLRQAITWYQAEVARRIDIGSSPDLVCNSLTGQFGNFAGPERASFCTRLVAQVAEITAEALVRFAPGDVVMNIEPIASKPDGEDPS